MKTFALFFTVTVFVMVLITFKNSEGLPDGKMESVDDEMSRIKRDTSDFQKEMEERIEKLKENAQAVKERILEEYEKLKKMMTGGVESIQEKVSMDSEDKHYE